MSLSWNAKWLECYRRGLCYGQFSEIQVLDSDVLLGDNSRKFEIAVCEVTFSDCRRTPTVAGCAPKRVLATKVKGELCKPQSPIPVPAASHAPIARGLSGTILASRVGRSARLLASTSIYGPGAPGCSDRFGCGVNQSA
jgi:hypothetical protein